MFSSTIVGFLLRRIGTPRERWDIIACSYSLLLCLGILGLSLFEHLPACLLKGLSDFGLRNKEW